MQPRIETLPEKKLVGKRMKMSFANFRPADLWRTFMPRRKEIKNNVNSDLISMQVYPVHFDFNPQTEFEKWAAVEVSDFNAVPDEMETFILPGGQYAVFLHTGSSTDDSIYHYIFTTWLPSSGYALDDRPHFEILGNTYRNNDANSEEEIWIPIRQKS